jgi:hypothetical protein
MTAVKMSATIKNNYFLEKVEAPVEVFSLCGFLWRFVIQYNLEKSPCSLLNRIFNDEMNDLWSAKCSSL